MAHYICPNCHDRIIDTDGRQGLSHQAVGCERCGFGFVFELLDDYYPRPESAMVVCDAQLRVLAAGRGTFELTGYRELDLLGQPFAEALGLTGFADATDPIATVREWGVRQLGQAAVIRHAAGRDKRVLIDLFPELNGEGGLLVVLAPRSG